MAISFNVTADERSLIEQIAVRADSLATELGAEGVDRLSLVMDLTATHANGCALRLADLLAADRFNFIHDVWGVQRHLDRRTGTLGNHFRPRFAARETAAA